MTISPAFPLELLNGSAVIVDGAFLLWGVWYLWRETWRRDQDRKHRHISLWRWAINLPASMNLVVAVLVHDAGVWTRSMVIWLWRVNGAGDFTMTQLLWLATGGLWIVVGGLCKIRAVTKPAYGDEPWQVSLILVLLFLAGSMLPR